MVAEHLANKQLEAPKMWPREANTACLIVSVCSFLLIGYIYVSDGEEFCMEGCPFKTICP